MTGTYFRVETWHSSYKGKRDSNNMRTKSYFCLKRRHSLCTLIYLHPTKVGILIFILFLVKYRVPLNTVYLQMQRWRNTFWCLATNLLKNRNGLDGFLKRSSVVYFFFFLLVIIIRLKIETLIPLRVQFIWPVPGTKQEYPQRWQPL